MSDYLPPTDGWTVDDLEAMPEDGVRRELLAVEMEINVPIKRITPRYL